MVEHDGTAASSPVTSCRTSRPPDTPKAPIRLPMGMAAPGHHPGPLPAAVGHEVGSSRVARGRPEGLEGERGATGVRARTIRHTDRTYIAFQGRSTTHLHGQPAGRMGRRLSRPWRPRRARCAHDMPPLAGNMARIEAAAPAAPPSHCVRPRPSPVVGEGSLGPHGDKEEMVQGAARRAETRRLRERETHRLFLLPGNLP